MRHKAAANVKSTWREEQGQVHSDGRGGWKPGFTKTFDVIMLEGETYKKLVLQDGKPFFRWEDSEEGGCRAGEDPGGTEGAAVE